MIKPPMTAIAQYQTSPVMNVEVSDVRHIGRAGADDDVRDARRDRAPDQPADQPKNGAADERDDRRDGNAACGEAAGRRSGSAGPGHRETGFHLSSTFRRTAYVISGHL